MEDIMEDIVSTKTRSENGTNTSRSIRYRPNRLEWYKYKGQIQVGRYGTSTKVQAK